MSEAPVTGDGPLVLAARHRAASVGDVVEVRLPAARSYSEQRLADVVEGAGFALRRADPRSGELELERLLSIPDTVAPGMSVLVCGLNPGLTAAEAGIGFVRPGNRFWPAALAAGLVSRDRDPVDALERHGLGMTDLVKRATRRAEEVGADEFVAGLGRVRRLVEWLQPTVVCMVGLAGWRRAADRRAGPGWQDGGFAGRALYLMPSTSGLNARSSLDSLTDHLVEVGRAGPARPPPSPR